MPSKYVFTSQAPKPIGPYSGIEAQTEQALQNLLAVLREAKMGPENVVKTTVYLADMGDFPKMNEVYERHLGRQPPARTTLQAAALPMGVRVEIEVVAAF